MGGTELLSALQATVNARERSRTTEIVMLTDGEVWGLDKTINFVQDTTKITEGRVRFFALGIGNAVSHELVEGVAKAGGGYAEVIPVACQGGWEDRVVAMLDAALAGHVGHLSIEFAQNAEGEQPADGKISLRYTQFPLFYVDIVLVRISSPRSNCSDKTRFPTVASDYVDLKPFCSESSFPAL